MDQTVTRLVAACGNLWRPAAACEDMTPPRIEELLDHPGSDYPARVVMRMMILMVMRRQALMNRHLRFELGGAQRMTGSACQAKDILLLRESSGLRPPRESFREGHTFSMF